MTHLIDTDILSIWEGGVGPEYAVFALRLSAHPADQIGVSIVSFHEQLSGAAAYLNRGRTAADVVAGYERLEYLRQWFVGMKIVPFDAAAATVFDQLKAAKVRIGTMDLRIASIALARGLTLVTRNTSDFAQVPGLSLEDWTR